MECNNGLQVGSFARLDINPAFCLERLELDGLYVNDFVRPAMSAGRVRTLSSYLRRFC